MKMSSNDSVFLFLKFSQHNDKQYDSWAAWQQDDNLNGEKVLKVVMHGRMNARAHACTFNSKPWNAHAKEEIKAPLKGNTRRFMSKWASIAEKANEWERTSERASGRTSGPQCLRPSNFLNHCVLTPIVVRGCILCPDLLSPQICLLSYFVLAFLIPTKVVIFPSYAITSWAPVSRKVL